MDNCGWADLSFFSNWLILSISGESWAEICFAYIDTLPTIFSNGKFTWAVATVFLLHPAFTSTSRTTLPSDLYTRPERKYSPYTDRLDEICGLLGRFVNVSPPTDTSMVSPESKEGG